MANHPEALETGVGEISAKPGFTLPVLMVFRQFHHASCSQYVAPQFSEESSSRGIPHHGHAQLSRKRASGRSSRRLLAGIDLCIPSHVANVAMKFFETMKRHLGAE